MEILIEKKVTEILTISLPESKYITLHDSLYWRFEEKDGKVVVTYISAYEPISANISIREFGYSSDVDAFFCNGTGHKEITAAEFETVLKNCLQKNGLIAVLKKNPVRHRY